MLEPNLVFAITYFLGLSLVILGLVKLIIYLIGEIRPRTWNFVASEAIRKFMAGLANRLIFGLGGTLTALVGGGFMWLAKYLEKLESLL